MLDAVTKGFRAAKHKLTGKAELTEANIDDALRDIRVALLEADVEFNVAKRFLARVKEKAVGEVVATAVTDRPAAVEQLKQLGDRLEIPVFHEENVKPPDMAQHALAWAGQKSRDVVLYDTAGRLAIDEEMMSELEQLKARVEPENILLVADAMIGQDAVKTAAEYDRRLSLAGFVLTKLDGDARGGAALSIKEVTGRPIKFIGMGEAMDKLEEFRPEGIASRILGFGDIVGLMKDFEGVVDEKKAEEDAEKILTGNFDLHDFVEQIKLVKKMGSVNELLEKFPLFGELPEGVTFDDKELHRVEAIISSMTQTERKNPSVIGDERIARIARGSGQKKEHVRGLLDRFFAMQKVMRQLGGGPGAPGMNLLQRLPGFRQLAQLKQLKGMPPEDLAKLFGLPKDLGAGALPAAGGKGSHSAAMARTRLMGMGGQPARVLSDEEKRRLREKRKKERQNKKKNRRR